MALKTLTITKRDGNYYTTCPHCAHRDRTAIYVAAHDHEELVYTCPACGKRSVKPRRALELAREEEA